MYLLRIETRVFVIGEQIPHFCNCKPRWLYFLVS